MEIHQRQPKIKLYIEPTILSQASQELSCQSFHALIERWRYHRRIVRVEWVHKKLRGGAAQGGGGGAGGFGLG